MTSLPGTPSMTVTWAVAIEPPGKVAVTFAVPGVIPATNSHDACVAHAGTVTLAGTVPFASTDRVTVAEPAGGGGTLRVTESVVVPPAGTMAVCGVIPESIGCSPAASTRTVAERGAWVPSV